MDDAPQSVAFGSEGTTCRGDLYLPDDVESPPVVVAAHGFGGERTWRLPAFARRFADRGLATLLFDYRSFGDSDGTPRNLIDPARHLADWRAAVAHARSRPAVDGDRVALWGTSFSGGHVIETAATDGDVAAVVAQVPFVDGLATLGSIVRHSGLAYLREATAAGVRDRLGAILGRDPVTVPIVGPPDEFALLNTPECLPGYRSIVPDPDAVPGEAPARIALDVPWYRPVTAAPDVDCPTFVLEATQDSLIPSWSVARLVSRLDHVERRRLPVGHFDVYTGAAFERAVTSEAAFLVRHLRG